MQEERECERVSVSECTRQIAPLDGWVHPLSVCPGWRRAGGEQEEESVLVVKRDGAVVRLGPGVHPGRGPSESKQGKQSRRERRSEAKRHLHASSRTRTSPASTLFSLAAQPKPSYSEQHARLALDHTANLPGPPERVDLFVSSSSSSTSSASSSQLDAPKHFSSSRTLSHGALEPISPHCFYFRKARPRLSCFRAERKRRCGGVGSGVVGGGRQGRHNEGGRVEGEAKTRAGKAVKSGRR